MTCACDEAATSNAPMEDAHERDQGLSVIEIHPVGYGYEANRFAPHGARLVDRYRYLGIVKLEIMCGDDQVDTLLEVVQSSCRTDNLGDGMLFVSDAIEAIQIRDGARGEHALREGRRRGPGRRGTSGDNHPQRSPANKVAYADRCIGKVELGKSMRRPPPVIGERLLAIAAKGQVHDVADGHCSAADEEPQVGARHGGR